MGENGGLEGGIYLNGYSNGVHENNENQEIHEEALEDGRDSSSDSSQTLNSSRDDHVAERLFDPPLYFQRYEAAIAVLDDFKWKKDIRKIIDFGCAECKFLLHLRNLENARQVVGVDIDGDLLERAVERTSPLPFHYLEQRTVCPLDVYLMRGSVAEVDQRLVDADAVTAIELIEHLPEDVLLKFPETVFGRIRPKLAIISTPNQEYNVLFPSFEGPFRHWDHKFEWTRRQFQDWAEEIVSRFPDYSVRYSGVGAGPPGTEDTIGFCSQIAVFSRKDFDARAQNGELEDLAVDANCGGLMEDQQELDVGVYRIVGKHTYPFRLDTRTKEEKIFHEAHYILRRLAMGSQEWEEGKTAKIPIDSLKGFEKIDSLGVDTDTIRSILSDKGCETIVEHSIQYALFPYEEEEEEEESGSECEPNEDSRLREENREFQPSTPEEMWD